MEAGEERRREDRRGEIPLLLRENDKVSVRQSQLFACRRFKIIHPVERERKKERKEKGES